MPPFPSSRIRNVAVVGHAGAGKTTLVEALALCAGALNRPGRVEDGTTVSDTEPEEHKRGISIATAVVPIEWTPTTVAGSQTHKINLLDCPGEADFLPAVEAALRVVDLAVFVVSAVDGVEVGTEQAWRLAADLGLPRMVFVNKLDRERADFERTLTQLQEVLGEGMAPLELPIGTEADFAGVVDLLLETAITYADGRPTTGPIPDDLVIGEHDVHDALVEGIVVADDELTERYLEGETLPVEELEKALALGVDSGQVFPVVLGSATRRIGIDRLATLLCEIGPSPLDRPPVVVEAGTTTVEIACDSAAQPLAVVWRTIDDRFVGKTNVARCLSGTITPDIVLVNSRTHAEERLHQLLLLRGANHEPMGEVTAGDLFAVPKLSGTGTGDTLAPKGQPVRVPWPQPAPAAFRVAIAPRSKGDDDKLMTALHRLQDEDPGLEVRRHDATHQTLLGGTGETHVGVTLDRLRRKFSVDVDVADVRVPYLETIVGTATAEGRYKKQTGGHGQFGVCTITIEPLERGAGYEFVDKVVGGAISRSLIPAVGRGVEEAMSHGGEHGFPVVDVRVTLTDGRYHPVDSSEMSFRMAGSLAFRDALAKAAPVVLEPVSVLTVIVPLAFQGDVMGDLNARRGRVQGTEMDEHGNSVIIALVPEAELLRYAIDLRSMTGGRGRFSLHHDHHDVLPAHLVTKLTPAV